MADCNDKTAIASVSLSVLVTAFATSLGQEVKACFDLDVTGDWQLHRFHTLRDTLAGSIKTRALE